MRLIYLRTFQKSFKKLDAQIQHRFQEKLTIFVTDPEHPLLYNHPLKGDKIGLRSISITGDFRLIFREISQGTYELVELVDIGTHSQLYG